MRTVQFLVAWSLGVRCLAFGAEPIVWVVPNSLMRVYPADAAGSGTTATLYCARGEYCPFQVAVQAPAGGLINISSSVGKDSNWGDWTTDPNALVSARERLGNQISSSNCAT